MANNTFLNIRPLEQTELGYLQVQAGECRKLLILPPNTTTSPSLFFLVSKNTKVYLDDQMSGYHVVNNTFINCQAGILLGGGRKTILAGNHFINVDLAIQMDNRGMNWQASSCQPPNGSDYTFAQAFMNLPAWKPYNVTLDHACVPVYNIIENNTYCQVQKNASFTPQDAEQWMDFVTNNIDKC